ncbi:MAG: VTC domain-containing protein [Planctomycetes bacterium]|nr:VTC domain-containing protein [Planctomycetota bacterium]
MAAVIRMETKYLVAPAERDELLSRLVNRMGPPSECRILSAYFDGTMGRLSRLALEDPRFHMTIRSREYEVNGGSRSSSSVWLEVKLRIGERCVKIRREFAPRALGRALSGGDLQGFLAELARESLVRETRLYSELRGFPGSTEVAPVGVTGYRRAAFEEGGVRVTLDMDLSFYPPPSGLYQDGSDLRSAKLPEAWFTEPQSILEVKSEGPVSLNGMIGTSANVDYSKFVRLVRECRERLLLRGKHADLLRRD